MPGSQRSTHRGRKIALFSTLANCIFLPQLRQTDLLGFAGSCNCPHSSLAFWLQMSWRSQIPSVLLLFFPKPFLFRFSLLFATVILIQRFPFLQFLPPSMTSPYHPLSPPFSIYCCVLKGVLDFWAVIFLKSNENRGIMLVWCNHTEGFYSLLSAVQGECHRSGPALFSLWHSVA